jgi:chromate transporter
MKKHETTTHPGTTKNQPIIHQPEWPRRQIDGLTHGASPDFLAAVATFLPCYLFTIIPAPYFRKHGKRPGIVAFVDGVTAAAIGAISGAVIVLGRRTLVEGDSTIEIGKVLILVMTVAVLWRFKRLPEPIVVAAAAMAGLVLYQRF